MTDRRKVPKVYKALGLLSSATDTRNGGVHLSISALRRWRLEDQEFRGILSYMILTSAEGQ